MGVKELFGLESRKVRYAIAGLGNIAQEDMMPGFDHTGNSEIAALVTGDPVKATELGERYKVAATYTYEQFGEAVRSGTFDAIYSPPQTGAMRSSSFLRSRLASMFYRKSRSRFQRLAARRSSEQRRRARPS